MDIWKGLGSFISRHLVEIVPVCLVAGVLVPDAFSWMRPAISTFFAFMTFQSSLGNNFKNLKAVLTHPLPIILVLAFSHIVAPLLASVLGHLFFGFDPNIVAGIVLEYSVPVATSCIVWVTICRGNIAASLTTLLLSTLITPFTTPLTLHLLIGATVQVDTVKMIFDMAYMVAVPALMGLLLNEATHGWGAHKLSAVLAPVSRIILPLIITVNTTSISSYILNLTPELIAVLAFIGCMAAGTFIAGFVLARLFHLKRDSFVSVVFGCGTRNIAAGAVIAAQYFEPATIFPVMCGVLFQQILAAVFGRVGQSYFSRPEQ